MDYRECKNCKKSIQGDSAFCPHCGKAIRKKDAPIAGKLLKRIGKPTRGTDAPVDIEVRKFKKRLLLIGIPTVLAVLAVAVWFILTSSPLEEEDVYISDHVFSDPLPDDCDIEPLAEWHPESSFDSLIWGDYIIKLQYDTPYIQTPAGASLMGIVNDGLVVADFTDFLTGMEFESMQTEHHINDTVPKLPLRIIAGPNSLSRDYEDLAAAFAGVGYGFLEYWVYSETAENVTRIGFPYRVEGNRIFVYPEFWLVGEEVEVETESAIEFAFFFGGFYLVLERDGLTVTMIPRQFVDDEPIINIHHRVLGDAEFAGITEIGHFAIRAGANNASGVIFEDDPAHSVPANIELYRCGRMRILTDDTELWVRYIWSGNDGLILIDENGNIYRYQMHGRVEIEPTPEPTPELAQQTFLERLEEAFVDAGSEVEIDHLRGTVTVNNHFLFERGSYELAEDYKENLENLLGTIADVIQSDDYVGTVARIIIEGHTCSNGSTAMNRRLSENRAQAVRNFAIIEQPELAEIMETEGKWYTEPILDDDGNEDSEASRRVVLLFDIRVAT